MEEKQKQELLRAALLARERAYAPYSRYQVGAALLSKGGNIYTGVNIENSSLGGTCCAERTALFKAVSEGEREFAAIAIAGGYEGKVPEDFAYPCGICRQVLAEFCREDFIVLVAKSAGEYQEYLLSELLPHGFSL